jgi:hypothetical protein
MSTQITVGNSTAAINGSPDKRIFIDGTGTYWAMIVVANGSFQGRVRFYKSANNGSTWAYSGASDLLLGQNRGFPSIHIDAEGNAHVSFLKYDANPQVLVYSRGTLNGSYNNGSLDTFWQWQTLNISPAGGRVWNDSDVIAFRNGTGWVAFITYALGQSSTGAQVARVNITNKGVLSLASNGMGPSTGLEAAQQGSIEFAHTGNGKTASASPHLFLGTASIGSSAGIRIYRATYSSTGGGTWTWGTPLTLATGTVPNGTFCGVYDGSRYMFAYAIGTTISLYEWDGVAGSATARTPPAAPGGIGNVIGLTLACDPVTTDLYLMFHDATDGDIRWSKFTRTALTWSAWSVFASRSSSATDGQVNLPRHPTTNTLVALFSIPVNTTNIPIYSSVLATFVRTPNPPTLLTPVSGSKQNFASGGTFTWDYNELAPGDFEIAFIFKRVNGGTTEYWNQGTQAWQSTVVANAENYNTPNQITFPAGKWTNGVTYTWTVQSASANNDYSAFASPATFTPSAAPVVVVTAPIDVVYEETTPLITWTYTSIDPQQSYEVRVLAETTGISPTDPTPAVWTSGVVGSAVARSVRVLTPLSNNTAYRAYVRATSSTSITSDWTYASFAISVTPPNGPTVTPSVVTGASGAPRVSLVLLGGSSFLSEAADSSATDWESDSNVTVADQADDTVNNRIAGFKMTSVAAGTMGVRSVVGSPPEVAAGETPLAGPLNFPVTAGQTYTLVASLKAGATTRNSRLSIRWYDDDDGTGTLLSTSVSNTVSTTSTTYAQNTLTATAPATATLARVVIEVLSTTAAAEIFYVAYPSFAPGSQTTYSPGGFVENESFRVERSIDGGTTWTTVARNQRPNYRQMLTLFDREMPFATLITYRAYTDVDRSNGSTLTSAASSSATVTVPAIRWGVRDVDDDAGELYGYVVGITRGDDEMSSSHRPAGRYYPIVDTEGLQASTGSIDLYVSAGTIAAATDILQRTSTFIIQSPNGDSFYARLIRRNYNVEQLRNRIINIDYIEVERDAV